jgi:ArsR family transcriptional regulator
MSTRPGILDQAAILAENTRCRILRLLDRHELTVSELGSVLQLPQSTTRRHLKVLADAGWVRSRREGTSHLYQSGDGVEPSAAKLWELIRDELDGSAAVRQDRRRLESVLRERRSRSQEFFSGAAHEWDQVRDELFGRRFDLLALPGLFDRDWVVGDLGCGTGRISEALAPFVARVIAVDGSATMLEAARERLERFDNVELRESELESLPIESGRLDAATLVLALHHLPEPVAALCEARRVLKPGGRLLVRVLRGADPPQLRGRRLPRRPPAGAPRRARGQGTDALRRHRPHAARRADASRRRAARRRRRELRSSFNDDSLNQCHPARRSSDKLSPNSACTAIARE